VKELGFQTPAKVTEVKYIKTHMQNLIGQKAEIMLIPTTIGEGIPIPNT